MGTTSETYIYKYSRLQFINNSSTYFKLKKQCYAK